MNRESLAAILELPPAERLAVVQEIWESLVHHPESLHMTEAQKAELEKRWITFQNDPNEGEPWSDVKAALLRE